MPVHVPNLRRTLEDDPRRPQRLLTRWGVGYVLARPSSARPPLNLKIR